MIPNSFKESSSFRAESAAADDITAAAAHNECVALEASTKSSRKALRRLLRRSPELSQAIEDRRFRWVIFEVLRDPQLRQDEVLLDYIRTTMLEHAVRKTGMRRSIGRLGAKPTLRDLGLTDMVARLGMPPTGYTRGTQWENLHRRCVVGQGTLPPKDKVLDAIHEDLRAGSMKRLDAVQSADRVVDPARVPINHVVNSELSAFLRTGSISAAGRRVRKGRPPEQETSPASSRTRPSAGGHQVSRLFALINQQKQRGFRPDRVTANIALKCWLRSLEAPTHSSPILPRGLTSNTRIAQSLHSVLDHVTLDELVSQRRRESSTELSNSASGATLDKTAPISYDRHVKPLGRLLVRAARSRGDWLAARRILIRLSALRSHVPSQQARPPTSR